MTNHGIAKAAIETLRMKERRQSARHEMHLVGRVRFQDGREVVCHTRDASVGGLEVIAKERAPVGTLVTCQFEGLGWIDGEVRRHTDDGFGLAFRGSNDRLARISARVEWLALNHLNGEVENRASARLVPTRRDVTFCLGEGKHQGLVIDVSRSGAAIASSERPATGSAVTVGMRRAKVIRLVEEGFAVEFNLPLSVTQFDHNIVL